MAWLLTALVPLRERAEIWNGLTYVMGYWSPVDTTLAVFRAVMVEAGWPSLPRCFVLVEVNLRHIRARDSEDEDLEERWEVVSLAHLPRAVGRRLVWRGYE